jgi:hypothetical protein
MPFISIHLPLAMVASKKTLFLYSPPPNSHKGCGYTLSTMFLKLFLSWLGVDPTKPFYPHVMAALRAPATWLVTPQSPTTSPTYGPLHTHPTTCFQHSFRLHDPRRNWLFRNVGNQLPKTPNNIPEERGAQHFRYLQIVKPRHLIQWEEKPIRFNDIHWKHVPKNIANTKIPLNSRKITDTNDSQITRNRWVLIRKTKTVRPLHNVHQYRDLLHTYMCMSLSVCRYQTVQETV